MKFFHFQKFTSNIGVRLGTPSYELWFFTSFQLLCRNFNIHLSSPNRGATKLKHSGSQEKSGLVDMKEQDKPSNTVPIYARLVHV